MVGRETELTHLHSLFVKALNGDRQVVFVTGEPVIGKTTLIEAFLQRLKTRDWRLAPTPQASSLKPPTSRPCIGRGQCIKQYGANEAYLPVFEALASLGGEAHGDQLTLVLQQYAPTWVIQMPGLLSPDEIGAVQPQITGASRGRMLREFAEAIEVFTKDRVLVLWFDDLHDGDPSTLDLIVYLARRQQPARLLLLGRIALPRPSLGIMGYHGCSKNYVNDGNGKKSHSSVLMSQP